jgi:hypothetical protein
MQLNAPGCPAAAAAALLPAGDDLHWIWLPDDLPQVRVTFYSTCVAFVFYLVHSALITIAQQQS